jgi:hypothetical protein
VSDAQVVGVPLQVVVPVDQEQPNCSVHAVWLAIDVQGAIVPLHVLVVVFQVHPVASSQYVSYDVDSLKNEQV